MEKSRRKAIRLPDDAYTSGWFFVTVCTEQRKPLFAAIRPSVGADDSVRPCGVSSGFTCTLTAEGEIVRECLEKLNEEKEGILLDKYVIMPNHIHMILCLEGDADGRAEAPAPTNGVPGRAEALAPAKGTQGRPRPSLPRIIQRFKSITTRQCWPLGHKTVWQRSFYDHVIRSEQDYLHIWQYIDENPARWAEDEYYA